MYKTIKSMRQALAEARAYRDPVNEDKGFSSQQIKMAYGVLNDPRYKQGNYSGAFKAIEKIARGLASHPDVANALKRANEETDLEENVNAIVSRVKGMVGSVEYDKKDRAIIVPDKDVKKVADFVKRQSGSKEIYVVIGDKENVVRTTAGKAFARKIKDRFYDDKIHGKQDQVIINPSLGMREELDKDDEKSVDGVVKQLKKAVKAHQGQVDTLTKDLKDEKDLEETFTKKDFKDNERDNEHGLNAKKVVDMFGTGAEKMKIDAINARHNMRGSISREDQRTRDDIVNKYYSRLK